jgi:hypothetical protein
MLVVTHKGQAKIAFGTISSLKPIAMTDYLTVKIYRDSRDHGVLPPCVLAGENGAPWRGRARRPCNRPKELSRSLKFQWRHAPEEKLKSEMLKGEGREWKERREDRARSRRRTIFG